MSPCRSNAAPLVETRDATHLYLDHTSCEVEVVVDPDLPAGSIRLQFEMSPERAARIDRTVFEHRLVVHDHGDPATTVHTGDVTIVSRGSHIGSMTVRGRGAVGVSISGGQVVVNGTVVQAGGGNVTAEPAKLIARVNRGARVVVEGANGDVAIGDTDGQLVVAGGGVGDVTAGRVTSAELVLSGTGDVTIAEVAGGDVKIRSSGTGDVEIEGGRCVRLEARLSGTGDMTFVGVAESADLAASGTGNIHVTQVTRSLRERSTGLGRIRVRKRPA